MGTVTYFLAIVVMFAVVVVLLRGLINTLNQDELLDLIAYILSGGNPQDARFAK